MDEEIAGLVVRVIDLDPDVVPSYLVIEIRAWNAYFAGTTEIYIELTELSRFAACISGLPSRVPEERIYEFGTRDPHVAGGYCRLRFYTTDGAGHAAIEVEMVGEDHHALARFTIPIVAAQLDRFVQQLYRIDATYGGEAKLIKTLRD